MIMVDQMRASNFWLPRGGQTAINGAIPNITALMNMSWVFPNYFTAATKCSPARATLLTGLYAPQTSMFRTQNLTDAVVAPSLLPLNPLNGQAGGGFPTIGDVLSQCLYVLNNSNELTAETASYICTWIGKWHVSCYTGLQGSTNGAGYNGPVDYGFTQNYFNLPTTSEYNNYPTEIVGATTGNAVNPYPSPNGMENEGNGGDFLDTYTEPAASPVRDNPQWPSSPTLQTTLPSGAYVQLNDAAIAEAFTNYWLPNATQKLTNNKWFCAVSFVNPHDISDFPYSFGLTPVPQTPAACQTSSLGEFCSPTSAAAPTEGYQPPPTSSTAPFSGPSGACTTFCGQDSVSIPDLNTSLYNAAPAGWNYPDSLSNKPGLQAYYQTVTNQAAGYPDNQQGWVTLLNYYFWMQSCVDQQISNILNGRNGFYSSAFNASTVIIFTADHGEYGGSHSLHAKGGALYDEVMNVPLYISFPAQRTHTPQTQPKVLPFVCSSVDILPFIYTLALGNHSWRNNENDLVNYLSGREDIMDAILSSTTPTQQRRVSGIPLANPPCIEGCEPWQVNQPFVLHTTDEYSYATVGSDSVPSHAVAYRTVDITMQGGSYPYSPPYGGGKIGVYSYWDVCKVTTPPIQPKTTNQQYEFYNYSTSPVGSPANTANPRRAGKPVLQRRGLGGANLPQRYGQPCRERALRSTHRSNECH
jgi:hypothetical protein